MNIHTGAKKTVSKGYGKNPKKLKKNKINNNICSNSINNPNTDTLNNPEPLSITETTKNRENNIVSTIQEMRSHEQEALTQADIPRAAKYAIIRDNYPDMPKKQAKAIVGYSDMTPAAQIEGTTAYQAYLKTIRARRAQMAERKGYRLEDSAKFYKDLADNADFKRLKRKAHKLADQGDHDEADRLLNDAMDERLSPSDRLKARTRLDEILGHNAPKELTQTVDNANDTGIPEFIRLINQLGFSPADLRQQLINNTPPAEEAADNGLSA